MNPADAVLSAVAASLPDDAVVTDSDRLASYRTDQMPGVAAGEPLAVVFPRTTEQVQDVMRAAYEHRVPVVPRGAGSGLSGGANAVDGCLVLGLERMNRIQAIDVADGIGEVEPGVINEELRSAARDKGLWYAPDPASRGWCTIGGNVSTNAGGLCCVKYGVTRDSVLGLKVVLADGRLTRIGRRSVKGVAGYDLVSLMVGSQGTLGVVTGVRVRLRPLPAPPATVVAAFETVAAAGRAVEAVMSATTPSLLELMDRTTVTAVEEFRPMGLDTSAGALLIAQTDGPGGAAEREADIVLAEMERAGATEAYRSEDEQQADMLLGARRLAIPALETRGTWLLDDVAVPRSRIAEAVEEIERIAAAHEVFVGTFGHAGDGNLHPTFVWPPGDDATEARARLAFDEVILLTLRLGGTVTGEHGVGLIKVSALGRELDATAMSMHAAIKSALDPRGILNPGKTLPLLG